MGTLPPLSLEVGRTPAHFIRLIFLSLFPFEQHLSIFTMADDAQHEHTFESADAGASATYPMQCSALRKGGFVMIKGKACKIVDMSTSKTGKHGHAKVHLVALDIFDNKKYEDICPSTHNMECPIVKRTEYQLLDVNDEGFVTLMDDAGETRDDLRATDEEVAKQIRDKVDAGEDALVCVLKAIGKEAIMSLKNMAK